MADSKFADAVVSRFTGGAAAPAASEPDGDEPEGDYSKADSENGRMLISAIKRGDGKAACEAVRRIMGE